MKMSPRKPRLGYRLLPGTLAGAFLLLMSVSARAATFVVTTTADGNNGACTVSLCTLRDAVIAANASPGSSITLPSNANPYTLTLTGVNEQAAATGDLDVTANLTINGGGAATTIIDGNATDRVFEVIGAVSLTLNNLTVRNGSTAASTVRSGGGINANTGTVVLVNSVLTANNAVLGVGGGINAAQVSLTNSTVSLNQAGGQGGGIFAGSATITGSTVSNNQNNDQGGGIFATSVTVLNSAIKDNVSTGDQGAGLFLINGTSNITASTISGSTGPDAGGGIFLNGSINANAPAILNITNSTITNNTISGGSGGG